MNMNRTPPWSQQESLPEITAQAGIDYDEFIAWMYEDHTLDELVEHFKVSQNTMVSLREHFLHYGISTVMGGD